MSQIEISREYAHPVERVWQAITDPEAIGEWLMETDFAPIVGHEFTLRTDPAPGFDGIVHGKVLRVEPPNLLEYSWRGGPLDTVIRFELSETREGTRLRVVHSGFKGFGAQLVRIILKLGSRSIYSKNLPRVLDAIRQGRPVSAPANAENCKGGLWRFVAWIFSPLLKRRTDR